MSIQLKISVSATGAAKVLRFAPDMTIAEVLKEIKEKTEIGGADHGLYQAAFKGKKPRWLQKNRTLKYYDITNNMELEYKKKSRRLKIKLPDDTVKTVMIDDSGLVAQIVKSVVEKLDIKTNPEEWGLRRETSSDNQFLVDGQTLQEQDVVDEEEQLLFEKKLFGMENTDMSDPVVLHYSYVQAKNRIITGKYPCQRGEAIALAALQVQVTYGNFDPNKHKPGFLKLIEYMAPQWQKNKNIEKDIFQEHKKFTGMTDIQAKYRYLQVVKSLKTYGITFFEVREKLRGKNKLVKILLGITRDKIIKADFETKEPMREWELTQMRRWAAGANSFTLDFGDYEEDYIVILTNEGEAISRLLGDYIDLILKARKDAPRIEIEDDTEVAQEEIISHQGGNANFSMTTGYVAGYDGSGAQGYNVGPAQNVANYMSGSRPQQLNVGGPGGAGMSTSRFAFPEAQKISVIDVGTASKAAKALSGEIGTGLEGFESTGVLTADQWRDQLSRNQDGLLANLGSLMNAARLDPGMFNRNALDNASKQINMELFGLATAAKNVAKLDDDLPTLEGAKSVADAIARLLGCADRLGQNPGDAALSAELSEAEKLLQFSINRLNEAKQGRVADKGAQLLMVECMNNIAMALDEVVDGSMGAASSVDAGRRAAIEREIESLKANKDWLMSTVSTLVPVSISPEIRKQIVQSAQALGDLGFKLVDFTKKSGVNANYLPPLDNAVKSVTEALRQMLDSTETAELRGGAEGDLDLHGTVNVMLATLSQLKGNMTDPVKLVNLVKAAVSTNNNLMTITEKIAGAADDTTRERLKKAGKNISEAMAKLVESARKVRENPEDKLAQQVMLNTSLRIENLAQDLLADAGETAALTGLRYFSKAATAGMVKLTAVAKQVGPNVSDAATRAGLAKAVADARAAMQNMMNAIRRAGQEPDNRVAQDELLQTAIRALPVYSELVLNSRKAQRFIGDANQKQDLTYAANESADVNKKLENACKSVSDLGGQSEFDEAMEDFDTAIADLDAAEFSAKQGLLVAIHGQTRENALELMNVAIKRLEGAMESLVETSKRGGKLPEIVRESAAAINQVSSAVRTMAGTVNDRTTQKRIIAAAKLLTTDTQNLITAGRVLAIDAQNKEKIVELDKNQRKTKSSLATLIASAKGLDARECDEAMALIQSELQKLTGDEATGVQFKQAAEGLTSVCKALSAAVSQLVAMARSNPRGLGASAKISATTMSQVIQAANIAASSSLDKNTSLEIMSASRRLADALNNLLNSAKYAAADRDDNSLANLASSNTDVTDSIQNVLSSLGGVTAPECDEAIRMIMDSVQLLDRGNLDGVAGKGRGELLNDITNTAKTLAQLSGRIVSAARVSTAKLGLFSKQAATVIGSLINAARSAAKQPEGGEGGGFSEDGSIVLKCVTLILQDTSDTNKVIAAAKKAAVSASKLIANNKEFAKAIPADQKLRQQNLVKAVKNMADAARRLAQAAQMSAKKTPDTMEELNAAAKDLKEKTLKLEEASGSGQTTGSADGVDPQIAKQLASSSKTVAVSTSELIRAGAGVSTNNNTGSSEELSKSTNSVSEAIQGLLIAAAALNPGVRECEKAADILTNAISDLDAANIALTVGQLQVKLPPNKTPQDIQNDMVNIAKDTSEDIRLISNAAVTGNANEMVTSAKNIQNRVPIMVKITKAVVSTNPNPQQQKDLLNMSKDMSEALLNLIKSCKTANPGEKVSVDSVKNNSENASQAVAKLLNMLQTGTTLIKDIDGIIAGFKQLAAALPTPLTEKPDSNYQVYRADLTNLSKELASAVLNLNSVNKASVGQVGLAANRLNETIPKLTEVVRKAAATTTDPTARQNLQGAAKKVLDCTCLMLDSSKRLTQNPNDAREQNSLRNAFNAANGAIGELITASKKGAIGEVMMDQAIEDIGKATANLNTTSIFAQAGQLEVPKEASSATMQSLESGLLTSAKKLLALCGGLDKSTQVTEEQLGKLAKDIAICVTETSNNAVNTASRVPDSISQQDILNSAKAVAIATQQILLSAKDVQRSPSDNTALQTLNVSQTGVAEAVNQLITTTKGASEEFARGELELENAKKAIEKVIQNTPGTTGAKPEDVIAALRTVTDATANIVFASNQEELIKAAQEASSGVEKMMNTARGAAQLTQDTNVRNNLASSCREAARQMVNLLETGKLNRQDPATQAKLEESSGAVTNSIQNVVTALRALPNAKDLSLEESSNLENLAESELLNAARVIEEAAKTLMNAKPRRTKPKVEGVVDEEDIVDAIIDAARAITTATGTLVAAAAVAQKERKTSLNSGALNKYRNDPTWANGLISAAKNVAGGVKMLVQASNSAVQGKAEEEHLVAAARAVAAATAHLVTASRVKADSNSKAQQNLTNAAKAVANATNELVKAAQHASNFEKEEEVVVAGSGIGVATQEFNQQAEILRLERELNRARQGLSKIRKERYSNNK
jgi:talin